MEGAVPQSQNDNVGIGGVSGLAAAGWSRLDCHGGLVVVVVFESVNDGSVKRVRHGRAQLSGVGGRLGGGRVKGQEAGELMNARMDVVSTGPRRYYVGLGLASLKEGIGQCGHVEQSRFNE